MSMTLTDTALTLLKEMFGHYTYQGKGTRVVVRPKTFVLLDTKERYKAGLTLVDAGLAVIAAPNPPTREYPCLMFGELGHIRVGYDERDGTAEVEPATPKVKVTKPEPKGKRK